MKYCIFLLILVYSCSSTKPKLKGELTVQNFKDRTMCHCLALGLDSNRSNPAIQKIVPYNPVATVLFDSVILENLKPVFYKIYADSIQRIGKITEAAQGKNIYNSCLEFYKSAELQKVAKKEINRLKKIKNLEETVSSKFPTW